MNSVKNAIVITSIFSPTEAVQKFSSLENHQLIVIGDKKTPSDWYSSNVDYFSVEEQQQFDFKLNKLLPYNHYSRKMLGYLISMQRKVNFIIDTDDDNIPKENWKFPPFESKYDYISDQKGFINIYQLYTKQKIWARGLPLKFINTSFKLEDGLFKKDCKVGIWQGLADNDPDVDAIYRLTDNRPCFFEERPPIVLGKGTISPFNTQNTIIRKELFPLMYLPTYVTFRFTDILRGLVAQPIMWLNDFHLGFVNATVVQERNPHDYFRDFLSEIPMYEHGEKIVELVSTTISKSNTIKCNLFNAYKALLKEKIICDKEMITLDAWLKDLENLKVGG